MSDCQGKSRWPELVGSNGNTAATVVERENSNVDAIVVREGSSVTGDFRCDRVWVWVNTRGFVTRTPFIGKSSWPELVGRNGDAAADVVERENPNVNAIIVIDGSVVTADGRCDRVRVWVNTRGFVSRTPNIG